jgi:hypothetical protein
MRIGSGETRLLKQGGFETRPYKHHGLQGTRGASLTEDGFKLALQCRIERVHGNAHVQIGKARHAVAGL